MKIRVALFAIALTGLSGAAAAVEIKDATACNALVDELANAVENKNLAGAALKSAGDLVTAMLAQCEAGDFAGAGVTADKLLAAVK